MTFGKRELGVLFNIFNIYYKDRPFISIAHRKHDYTIDPNLLSTNKYPDLLGIAVVYYSEASKKTALFEKEFYLGTYEIFSDLEKAKSWAIEYLEDYLKKAGL